MAERDEVQAARWFAIRDRVGEYLRALRVRAGAVSQARLSSDLEALGYRMTQSMVSMELPEQDLRALAYQAIID